MGGIAEFTTWPNHTKRFYHANSGALAVDIKAIGNALIGLSATPDTSEFVVTIGIDINHRTWIRNRREKNTVETPGLLAADEYRTFWIKYYTDSVCFGRADEKPIIVIDALIPSHKIKYITFFSLDPEGNAVHWRFQEPIDFPEPVLKPISGGKLHWVQFDDKSPHIPKDALVAGYETESLYIMRAPHSGSLTPGKYVSSTRKGYVGWSWDIHEKTSFEILCGYDCVWVPTSDNKIPPGAVVGGYSENRMGEPLYVGRGFIDGYVIPGKVQCSHCVCFIPYDGKERGLRTYEILVVPQF